MIVYYSGFRIFTKYCMALLLINLIHEGSGRQSESRSTVVVMLAHIHTWHTVTIGMLKDSDEVFI